MGRKKDLQKLQFNAKDKGINKLQLSNKDNLVLQTSSNLDDINFLNRLSNIADNVFGIKKNNNNMSFVVPNQSLSGDMIIIPQNELLQISELAKDTTSLNRSDLKGQKYSVVALEQQRVYSNKNLKAGNNFDDINNTGINNSNEQSNSNDLNIEPHPELPYTGGKPADQIYFPESIIESGQIPESYLSSSQKELKNQKDKKIKEKLEKSIKMANRMKHRITDKLKINAPKEKPKMQNVPRNRPLPKPNPY